MAFNTDELLAPTLFDQKFFTHILQANHNNKQLKITSYEVSPGASGGHHFASLFFRVRITYSSQTEDHLHASWIVKTMPVQEGVKKDYLDDGFIFNREIFMYTTAVVEMQRLLEQAGDNTKLAPRLIYSTTSPTFVLVFEDLEARGYEVKKSFLNFEETKMAIAKLAKWHATSYYMGQQQSAIKGLLRKPLTDGVKKMLGKSFGKMKAALKRDQVFEQVVGEKLEILADNWASKAEQIFRSDGDFCVLSHSDFHFKNAMYKFHEDGSLDDILLLDFQACHWGSPAIDLIYTLYAMASQEVRDAHRDNLVCYYYTLFAETLQNIGHMGNTPTLHDLQLELVKCGFIEVMVASCHLPLFYVDFSKRNVDANAGVDLFTHIYDVPEYQGVIRKLMRQFLHKGFLEL